MSAERRVSPAILAQREGVSRATLYLRARSEGDGFITEGRDGRRYASPKVRAQRIAEHRRLRAEGLKEREIAERTGWPRGTVSRDLLGVTTAAADPPCTVTNDSTRRMALPTDQRTTGSDDDGAE